MKSWSHAALAAAIAVAPDLALFTFAWRKECLPPSHPLVLAHRALHHPVSLVCVAWASHLIADALSSHPRHCQES
jgi:hypothetical protein